MSERTSDLLSKVEDALWLGDQRAAGILLHQILLEDFTNRQAWQQLYTIRGEGQRLEEFQQTFAQRYYPQLAHLLHQPPGPPTSESEHAAPEPLPLSPLSPAPPPPATASQFCPICGTALLPRAKFCIHCGATVPTVIEPAPPPPEPLPLETELTPLPPAPLIPAPLPVEPEALLEEPEPLLAESEPLPVELETRQTESEPLLAEPDMLPADLQSLLARPAPLPPLPLSPIPSSAEAEPFPSFTEAEPLPSVRKPYCPTCRKIFQSDVLFCDTCGAPLFQLVESLPTQPAAETPPALPAEPTADTPPALPPEPIPDLPDALPVEPAPSPLSSHPLPQRRAAWRKLPPLAKAVLVAWLIIVVAVCIGVILYILYSLGLL